MARYVLLDTIKTYNNGKTSEQVNYGIIQQMSEMTWDGKSPLQLLFRKANRGAAGLGQLGTAPDESEMTVMIMSIFSKSATGGN